SGRSGLEPEPLDEAGSFCTCFSNPKLGPRMSDFPLTSSGVRVFQGRLMRGKDSGEHSISLKDTSNIERENLNK
ncbi:MAG: hypothetical protein NTZ08_13545, partial [Verrucomicrobia bacterium]|nr:hypothetical protein [Verrucomicrobiota bacterium]